MLKIRMLGRFTAISGKKLEKGLVYGLPQDYAMELIKAGHAAAVIEEKKFAPAVEVEEKELKPKPKAAKPEPEVEVMTTIKPRRPYLRGKKDLDG